MGSGPNRKSKSFSSSETTLALASLVASASAAITRCISFAKHTSLISTLLCKRGRKFIFWLEILLEGKNICLINLWEVCLFVITMNKDSPEDMYSPLVRCTLKVRRQLFCNFLPRKPCINTEFLKVLYDIEAETGPNIYINYLSESISARLFVPKIFLNGET